MDIRFLSKDFAVTSQVDPAELARLREQGFAAVICNRPDGESAGQPPFAEIAEQARQHGMQACHLPVVPGKVTPADVEAFAARLAELPKPVLGFCRTGNRSQTLWTLAQEKQGGTAG